MKELEARVHPPLRPAIERCGTAAMSDASARQPPALLVGGLSVPKVTGSVFPTNIAAGAVMRSDNLRVCSGLDHSGHGPRK
jgi:hypothetical protein